MADEEIRKLEHRIKGGDKSAYPLLAVAFERRNELTDAAKVLKDYFNYLNKEPNAQEEQCVILNNYFRILLDYCNKQNNNNLRIEQLAYIVHRGTKTYAAFRPYQFMTGFNKATEWCKICYKNIYMNYTGWRHGAGDLDHAATIDGNHDPLKNGYTKITICQHLNFKLSGLEGREEYESGLTSYTVGVEYNTNRDPWVPGSEDWDEINDCYTLINTEERRESASTSSLYNIQAYLNDWAENQNYFNVITIPVKVFDTWITKYFKDADTLGRLSGDLLKEFYKNYDALGKTTATLVPGLFA